MVSRITQGDIDAEDYLEVLRENISRAYVSAILFSRLEKSKNAETTNPTLFGILYISLRDSVVLSLAKCWDTGKSNTDALSIPNLTERPDIKLSKKMKHRIAALVKSRIVCDTKFIRTQMVAHSLVGPDHVFSGREFNGKEYVEHLNCCAEILAELMHDNFGTTFTVSSQKTLVSDWEAMLNQLP